jgi:hypothetical protein
VTRHRWCSFCGHYCWRSSRAIFHGARGTICSACVAALARASSHSGEQDVTRERMRWAHRQMGGQMGGQMGKREM